MPYDILHKAIMDLPPTGDNGFEGFVSNLLTEVSGHLFRLLKSGPQGGADGLSNDFAIGFEGKQYGLTTRLPVDLLKAKITDAAANYPTLETWILATTRVVDAGDTRALEQTGAGLGLDVLVLDWADRGAIPPRLAVLCAAAPATTAHFLGKAININRELATISACVGFKESLLEIQRSLNDPAAGYSSTRSAIQKWTLDSTGDKSAARIALDSDAVLSHPEAIIIPRPYIESALTNWWDTKPNRPIVLLGNEGLGKTWAALSWALSQSTDIENFPLTLVIPAKVVDTSDGPSLLARTLHNRTSVKDGSFWARRVDRWADRYSGKPIVLIVIDGINQNWAFSGWSDLVASFDVPRWRGKVAVLFTCRPDHWDNRLKALGDLDSSVAVDRVVIEPFSDAELDDLLLRFNLERDDFQSALLPHLRIPRLARIAIERRDLLNDGGEITVERLIYEDWRNRPPAARQVLSHDDFIAFIGELGKTANEQLDAFTITRTEVLKRLSEDNGRHAEEFQGALSEIIDGSWFKKTSNPNRFELSAEYLPAALAQYALAELKLASNIRSWEETFARLFDPLQGSDLSVQILRFATTFGILNKALPTGLAPWLLDKWVSSQNFSQHDFQAFWRLIGCDPTLFVSLADTYWLERKGGMFSGEIINKGFLNAWNFPNVSATVSAWLQSGFSSYWLDPLVGEVLGEIPDDEAAKNRRIKTETSAAVAIRSGAVARFGLELRLVQPLNMAWWGYRATELLSWLPRAQLVNVFAAWAFVFAILPRTRSFEAIAWVLRYNGTDATETENVIIELVETLIKDGAEVTHKAAEILLSALGSQRAMHIWVEHFKETGVETKEENIWPEPKFNELPLKNLCASLSIELDPSDPNLMPPKGWLDSLGQRTISEPDCEWVIERFQDKTTVNGLVLARWAPKAFSDIVKSTIVQTANRLAKQKPPAIWNRILSAISLGRSKPSQSFTFPDEVDHLPAALLGLTDDELKFWNEFSHDALSKKAVLPANLGLALMVGKPAESQIRLLQATDLTAGFPNWCFGILRPPEDDDWCALEAIFREIKSDQQVMNWLGYLSITSSSLVPNGWPPLLTLMKHNNSEIRAEVYKLIVRSKNTELADELGNSSWCYNNTMEANEACWGSLALNLSITARQNSVASRVHPGVLGDLVELYPDRDDYFEAYANYVRDELAYYSAPGSKSFPRNFFTGIGGWQQLIEKRGEDFKKWMEPVVCQSSIHAGHTFFFLEEFPLGRGLDEMEELVPGTKSELITRELKLNQHSGLRDGSLYNEALTLIGATGEEARLLVLDEANDDAKLFNFVEKLEASQQTGWLIQKIKDDLESNIVGIVARAITLAGFMLPSLDAEALWLGQLSRAPAEGWLSEVHKKSRANYDRYKWSKYWSRRFEITLVHSEMYAAFELFLATLDRRIFAGRELPSAEAVNTWDWRKRHHFHFEWERVKRIAKSNHKELEKTFLLSKPPLQNQWPRKK